MFFVAEGPRIKRLPRQCTSTAGIPYRPMSLYGDIPFHLRSHALFCDGSCSITYSAKIPNGRVSNIYALNTSNFYFLF